MNYIKNFNKAIEWIKKNTVNGNGIAVTSKIQVIYPEVTGYYIPSLIQWGEKELAISYAKYLCSIQKEDGSWYDSKDLSPYVFDSAQILKGLISIRDILPEVDPYILKGCDWILSNMQPDGRLTTPNMNAWGSDENFCSELIHIYCLSPIKEAGVIFNKKEYIDSVNLILNFYKKNYLNKIKNFSLLSHFYAYVMEGLYDLGEIELCRESMNRLEKYRTSKNAIPGLNDVPWICSTGCFQLAVVWYKLGELDKGNSLFYYAISLQNESGGWYGSYPSNNIFSFVFFGRKKPFYFSNDEISWAVKYFLDALALKEKLEFEKQSSSFLDEIDELDGRYQLISNILKQVESSSDAKLKICDIGCGKGRYLKRLVLDHSNNEFYASDISVSVTKGIDICKNIRYGMMTNTPYTDSSFDIVYTCEAYEHSINIEAAFKELYRITKSGGKIIIIDKPIEKIGRLKLYEWEQWISDDDIIKFTELCGGKLEIIKSIPYENKSDGLFRAWVITKK